jgi:predicted DNA-binding transcriptional regulator AlpA
MLRAMRPTQAQPREPEPADAYLSIDEACARFGISRRTFYRLLADPEGGLDRVVLRIPPRTGHIRVPMKRFEQWLRARQ